ncbi:hypothetical protein OX284_014220 [Flavobacterium sp. SUN046]|uniref:hypothetical protein n=1 Tax=Flavobacterium sp. SUN046 TaxID=3002440 RepID=UPI002DBEC4CF|nr:hypothetical protein [Flavobacterium sp. SUN046]MEC4050591.1 hypothetical protein [Flavobacterium sp. SUN046]
MAKFKIKQFDTKEEQFKWLAENQLSLKAQRKAEPKKSDSLSCVSYAINERGEKLRTKEAGETTDPNDNNDLDNGVLKIRCIINTTGLFDSHCDVHIPGLWKKTLQENKYMYLCQEHELTFEGILAEGEAVKAYTKNYTWKELGFDFEGSTEALVFDCTLLESDNELMFNKYKQGKVRNHSVRMQAVKEYFCMNSDDPSYTQYKDNYEKYISYVVNKDVVEQRGWFYAVTEAKAIEGSAVVRGSNYATPTLEVTEKNKSQAEKSLENNNEPPAGTQTEKKKIFIN